MVIALLCANANKRGFFTFPRSIDQIIAHVPVINEQLEQIPLDYFGRQQSIGCALVWVTISRDAESEYPFNPVGQFHRICAGHL